METLVSMTDFVLEQERIIPNELNTAPMKDCDRLFVQRIILYARFLKQPLTISMFVPTDEDGNVLEEPEYYKKWHKWGSFSEHGESIVPECKKYFESKKRVLFEGFNKVAESQLKFRYGKVMVLHFSHGNTSFSFLDYTTEGTIFRDVKTIEDLVIAHELKLTKTAKKQIGLI